MIIRPYFLGINQFYPFSVTEKVCGVERQQPTLPMRQHSCYDVRVVDLTPARRDFLQQLE